MGALESLIESAIGLDAITKEMAENAEVAEAVHKRAEEAREFWVDYWEAFDHPYSREHALKSGYVERPGDYSNSIKIKFGRTKDGAPKATVGTRDYKAAWIEYCSSKMPQFAPCAATISHFGGYGRSISS
jgi:hypothetical protein